MIQFVCWLVTSACVAVPLYANLSWLEATLIFVSHTGVTLIILAVARFSGEDFIEAQWNEYRCRVIGCLNDRDSQYKELYDKYQAQRARVAACIVVSEEDDE